MDTRSKPTFVLLGHHLLFDNMFVCSHLAPFDSLTFSMISFYLFLCLFASLFLLSLHVHTWSMDTWSKGVISPRCKKKGQGCKHEDASPQRALFSRLRRLAPPKWFSLCLSLIASSLEHVLGFPLSLYLLLFLLFAWAAFFRYGNVCLTFPVPC